MRTLFLVLAAAFAIQTADASSLRRGNLAEPETLDPQKAFLDSTGNIILDLFVGLTTYDAASNPVPGSAESWTVSQDGLTYTFKLRKGLVWSDGTPIPASDFAEGIRRVMNPKIAAQLANLGFCIDNAVAVNAGKLPIAKLGVRALDAGTVEVKVEHPCPTLIAALAEPPFGPVPQHAIMKFGDDWIKPGKMVSNGAYTLAEWRANDHVRLVKNPRFYDAANVKIDEVSYYPTDDDAAALKRFRAGELDYNQRFSPSDIGWLRKNMTDAARLDDASAVNYLIFNHKRFTDRRVRRALAMAIDREMLTKQLTRLGEKPAYGVVPSVSKTYTAQRFDFAAQPLATRQTEARKLLAAAGYDAKKPLTFTFRQRTGTANQRIAIGLQSMWAQIGVKVDILVTETKSHFASMNVGDFDVGAVGLQWPMDPEYFLADLLEGSGTNYGRYKNPAYDAKFREAQAQVDLTKRSALFAEAEAMLLNDVAVAPLYFNVNRNLVASNLKGFAGNPRDFHLSRFMRLIQSPKPR